MPISGLILYKIEIAYYHKYFNIQNNMAHIAQITNLIFLITTGDLMKTLLTMVAFYCFNAYSALF